MLGQGSAHGERFGEHGLHFKPKARAECVEIEDAARVADRDREHSLDLEERHDRELARDLRRHESERRLVGCVALQVHPRHAERILEHRRNVVRSDKPLLDHDVTGVAAIRCRLPFGSDKLLGGKHAGDGKCVEDACCDSGCLGHERP